MATTQWKKNNITYDIHDSRLPSSYGTAGQVLATNLSCTGIEWVNQSGGTSYTAGDNIQINNNVISATDTTYTAGQDITLNNNVIQTVYGGSYTPPVETIVWNFNGSWTTGSGGIAYLEIGTSAREPKFVPGTTYNYEIIVDGVTYTGQSVVNAMEGTNWMRIGDVYSHFLNDSYPSSSSYITWSTAGHVVTRVKVYTQVTQPTYTPINANYVPVDGETIYIQNGVIKSTGGSGGEPAAYLKSASSSGNTLTLVNKDDSTTTYTPTVPTKTSDLTNDSGFLTEHQSLANYSTTSEMNSAIASHHDSTKQDTLTAGDDIVINNNEIETIYGGSRTLSNKYLVNNQGTYTSIEQAPMVFCGSFTNRAYATTDFDKVIIIYELEGTEYTKELNASDFTLDTSQTDRSTFVLNNSENEAIQRLIFWENQNNDISIKVNLVVKDSITIKSLIVIKYNGITTYSPISTNYMPIDNDTIYVDDGVLKAQGGSGGNYSFTGSLNKTGNIIGSSGGSYIFENEPIINLNGVCLLQSSSNTWTFLLNDTPSINTSNSYRTEYAINSVNSGSNSGGTSVTPYESEGIYYFNIDNNSLLVAINGKNVTVTTNRSNRPYLTKLIIFRGDFSTSSIDTHLLGVPEINDNGWFERDSVYYSKRGWFNKTNFGLNMIGSATAGQRDFPTTAGNYKLQLQVTGDGTLNNPITYNYIWVSDS